VKLLLEALITRRRPLDTELLLSLIILSEMACLLFGIFGSSYFNYPLNERLSWPALDFGGDFRNQNVIGIHSFSDFMQPYAWSMNANPWALGLNDATALVQYPPLAVYAIKAFALVPYRIAVFIYLAGMCVSMYLAVCKMAPNAGQAQRIKIFAALGLGLTPMMMSFDRGNLTGFFPLLLALFIVGVIEERRVLEIISSGLLIGIKIYPVFLLLIFIRKKQYAKGLWSLAFALLTNFFLVLLTPGNPVETVRGFLIANVRSFVEKSSDEFELLSGSLRALGFHDGNAPVIAVVALSAFHVIRVLGVLVLIVLVLFRKELSVIELVTFCGLAMTLAYSAQITYNWSWFSVILFGFFGGLFPNTSSESPSPELVPMLGAFRLYFVAMIVTLLPHAVHFPGSNRSLTPWLATLITSAFIAVVFSQFIKELSSAATKSQ